MDDTLTDVLSGVILGSALSGSSREDAETAANAAQASANYVGRQVAVLRQRVLELERDNALLAVVLLHTLKQLEEAGGMSREEFKSSLREELARLREEKCEDFLNVFREKLDLPRQMKTDVSLHKPARPAAPKAKAVSRGKPAPQPTK
jgi:DNA-binding HxlR family transcriptional regulator